MNNKENIWFNRLKKADFLISHAVMIQPLINLYTQGNFDPSTVLALGAFLSYWERRINPGTIGSLVQGIGGYSKSKESQFSHMDMITKAIEYGQRIVTHGILWSSISLGVYELFLKTLVIN